MVTCKLFSLFNLCIRCLKTIPYCFAKPNLLSETFLDNDLRILKSYHTNHNVEMKWPSLQTGRWFGVFVIHLQTYQIAVTVTLAFYYCLLSVCFFICCSNKNVHYEVPGEQGCDPVCLGFMPLPDLVSKLALLYLLQEYGYSKVIPDLNK